MNKCKSKISQSSLQKVQTQLCDLSGKWCKKSLLILMECWIHWASLSLSSAWSVLSAPHHKYFSVHYFCIYSQCLGGYFTAELSFCLNLKSCFHLHTSTIYRPNPETHSEIKGHFHTREVLACKPWDTIWLGRTEKAKAYRCSVV